MIRKRKSKLIRHTAIGSGHESAFTLIELLVVIGIIAVLIGILIPVVGRVRIVSQETATRALIGQIDAACQAYFGDFQAYPGPMSHVFMTMSEQVSLLDSSKLFDANFTTEITNGSPTAGWNGFGSDVKRLTGTENLVLGLTGGLQQRLRAGSNPPEYDYGFNKDSLGLGPVKFNPKRPGRGNPYMQNTNLSEGKFTDDASAVNPAKDTIVPEFIDSFSDPLPLLYMRARKGGATNNTGPTATDNNVVIDQVTGLIGQYNILEIAAYTQSSIGVGRSISEGDYVNHPASGAQARQYPHGLLNIDLASTLAKKGSASQYPYNAYAYLTEPSSYVAGQPVKHKARKTDGFILISAGKDRVYGTEDDLTNFGSVLP